MRIAAALRADWRSDAACGRLGGVKTHQIVPEASGAAKRRPLRQAQHACAGMTLIEVLMAVFILGVSIAGLMAAISQCATSFSIARRTQALQSVLDQAEIIHPMLFDKEPVDELAVAEDSGIVDGYTFTRECEEDEDEDGLYVVTSTVRSMAGGWGSSLTVVRYIYCAETRKK